MKSCCGRRVGVDAVYPIVYIDAIVVKIREGGAVDNRAAHLVIGVDVEGFKHVLGIWIAESEGAKFWQNVLNELVNRGLRDVLIVCCDGLTGLPDAIANVWGEGDRANLCGAPHPGVHEVRAAGRPQGSREITQADLYGGEPGRCRAGLQ